MWILNILNNSFRLKNARPNPHPKTNNQNLHHSNCVCVVDDDCDEGDVMTLLDAILAITSLVCSSFLSYILGYDIGYLRGKNKRKDKTMQSNIPPVYIVDPARTYDHFKTFKTRQEAVDFIKERGGMLVEDPVRHSFLVIHVPVKADEVVKTQVEK